MSSFFTLPTSQKKRKRTDAGPIPSTKRTRNVVTKAYLQKSNRRERDDESISGSDSDHHGAGGTDDGVSDVSSESALEDETGAERRLRLAERYLENIKGEVDEAGFDAEQIDRDLIAERLKEDVAETKGRLYRRIASDYDYQQASGCNFRVDTQSTTSIAVCPPYAYTVSKDITLIKWELAEPPAAPAAHGQRRKRQRRKTPTRRRPQKLLYTRGDPHKSSDRSYQHHTAPILVVAASQDGRFIATGGADKRLIIWNAEDLKPLRVFTQHRAAVTGLAFRRGTNQLYSSSADRTVKTWSLNELAYVETLFGHQDEVADVVALAQERCVSVGSRDRTVRLWKVLDETQLVFRGGGTGGEKRWRKDDSRPNAAPVHAEGSIDRVAMIDEETFVTGSDNGALCLWSIHKKKPVFTLPLAHGLDPPLRPDEAFAEQDLNRRVPGPPLPRWITALATVPYSDVIVSGSWDGCVRVWKISEDKKRIEPAGVVGSHADAELTPAGGDPDAGGGGGGEPAASTSKADGNQDGHGQQQGIRGVVNGLQVFERGDKGRDGLCILAALGKEHRLGRWKKLKGSNGAVMIEARKKKKEEEEGTPLK